MGKILEFKECSSEDWKRRFSSKEEIAELLNSIRIDDCELKDIMNTYLIDHNRLVVIARVRKKANGRLKKIVIDVKTGEPTFQQMMDLTFNLGSDSDKRVVVFDGSKVTEEIRDPGADRDMIQSFAQITNDCGVSTYVVYAKRSMGNDKRGIGYYLLEEPSEFPTTKYSKLPSKRKFERAEFNVLYYDSQDVATDAGNKAAHDADSWFDYRPVQYVLGLRCYPSWRGRGFFMNINGESSPDILKWLVEHKSDELREEYKGCEIRLQEKSGVPYKLSVRIWEDPFRNFVNSSASEKMAYASKVLRTEYDFCDFIDELVRGHIEVSEGKLVAKE